MAAQRCQAAAAQARQPPWEWRPGKEERGWLEHALRMAVEADDMERLKELLLAGGRWLAADINKGRLLPAILRHAIKVDNLELASVLISTGCGVDDADSFWGATPLGEAVTLGSRAMLQLLVSAGAKLDIQDGHGWTALHYATFAYPKRSEEERLEVIQCLAAAGADLNVQAPLSNKTPLMLAAEEDYDGYSCDGAVDLLVRLGAALDLQDSNGRTALQHALAAGNDSAAQILVAAGATDSRPQA